MQKATQKIGGLLEQASSKAKTGSTTRSESAKTSASCPKITDEERERFSLSEGVEVIEWGACERHGRFPSLCRKDGYVFMANEACPDCKAANQRRAVFGRAAIPRRYVDATVKAYVAKDDAQRAVKAAIADYCRDIDARLDRGDSILMAGHSGTGKSHLACAVARRALSCGRSALFIKARALVSDIRSTWRKDSKETERDAIERYTKIDLLVIDEVGAQFGTEAEALHLFDVIGERYAEMRSTILISNLPFTLTEAQRRAGKKTIEDYLGDAAFDRFREAGSLAIPFSWASHRGSSQEDSE